MDIEAIKSGDMSNIRNVDSRGLDAATGPTAAAGNIKEQ